MTHANHSFPPPLSSRQPGLYAAQFRSFRTISALVLREMSTTYGRTPGGYIWAILEPVAMIAVLAIAFSVLLRSPSLGTSFIWFYASAILPLRMFQRISGNVGGAIAFNRALMSYPRVTFVDVIFSRLILGGLTQGLVAVLVLVGVHRFDNVREIIAYDKVVLAFAIAMWIGFGVGTLNCYLTFRYPLWQTVWGILTRPLMLMSGIFFVYEDLPEFVQNILWYNPILHVTGVARAGLYSSIYAPQYISWIYMFMFGAIPMFFGVLLLRRFGKEALYK